MKRVAFLSALVLALCASAHAKTKNRASQASVDAEIQRLEAAKWHPSSIGGAGRLQSLFADDFVTVEFGTDVHGLVDRKFNTKQAMGGPDAAKLLQMLDQTQFEITGWHFVHVGADGVVVSYHISAPALSWNAYATSVWAKRGGRWQTVFYQASAAK